MPKITLVFYFLCCWPLLFSSLVLAEEAQATSALQVLNHSSVLTEEAQVASALQVLKLKHKTKVMLDGYIVEKMNPEEYHFQDITAFISIRVSYDKWQNMTWNPNQKVRIVGYVDTYSSRTKILVEKLYLLK